MGLKSRIRNKLDQKVFNEDNLASDCTVYTVNSESYDEYGSAINVVEGTSTVRIVPYNNVSMFNYQPFGDLEEGEMDAIFPYNTTLSKGDRVKLNSVNYEVKEIEKYLVENENIAILTRLTKKFN